MQIKSFLKVEDILNKLNNCINFKLPFSHMRFGDGGLKFIHSIVYHDIKQLNQIIQKEGLPSNNIIEILELWGYYARCADCIDTPEVYYNNTFWPRVKKKNKPISLKTDLKMKMWRELYSRAEIINDTYCNPESNCLMILKIPGKKNIFDIMKNRKICIITAHPKVINEFPEYDIDIIPIVGQWKNQFKNSFSYVINFIKSSANKYDFFLTAAGELGRIYTGLIKEYGGRTIDIGFIIEYWINGYIHPRFNQFVVSSINNRHELKLTTEGSKYLKYI
jgi:hypothetical protein